MGNCLQRTRAQDTGWKALPRYLYEQTPPDATDLYAHTWTRFPFQGKLLPATLLWYLATPLVPCRQSTWTRLLATHLQLTQLQVTLPWLIRLRSNQPSMYYSGPDPGVYSYQPDAAAVVFTYPPKLSIQYSP
jgi:hypothetical protein